MVQSKEWNWAQVTDTFWREPSEDVYYYVNRWRRQGRRRFLDLGCGLGRHALLFAENGFDTDALDLSPDGIADLQQSARERGLTIGMTVGDILQLPYENATFDCLLAYHVISHTDSQGIVRVASEILRVLQPDGEFYVTIGSKNNPPYRLKQYPVFDENTLIKTDEPEVGIPHFYADADDVRRIFQRAELIRLRQIEDIYDGTSSWHYYLHGRKQPETA